MGSHGFAAFSAGNNPPLAELGPGTRLQVVTHIPQSLLTYLHLTLETRLIQPRLSHRPSHPTQYKITPMPRETRQHTASLEQQRSIKLSTNSSRRAVRKARAILPASIQLDALAMGIPRIEFYKMP